MGHGRMNFGLKTARLVIVLVNLIFLIIGLILIGLGVFVKSDPAISKLKEFLPIDLKPGVESGLSYLEVIAIAMIVLGCVLAVIGFLGCCGAMKQVKVFLIIYAVIIIIIILIEVGIAIFFVAFRSKFESEIIPKLRVTVQDNYEGPLGLKPELNRTKPRALSLAWDFLMYNFQCCGVRDRSDFNVTQIWDRRNPWWNSSMSMDENFTYPLTCCPIGNVFSKNWDDLPLDKLQSAATCATTGNFTYSIGCYDKILDTIRAAQMWVIIVAVVVILIELLALVISLMLCFHKKRD